MTKPLVAFVLTTATILGVAAFGTLPVRAQAAPPAAAPAAAPVASTLPGGASSLQETYQDWQVACLQQGAGKRCALSQQQADPQSRQRVLAIELTTVADKAEGVLVLPFGLALDKGVTLQIDDGPVGQPLRFRTCLPAGCLVPLSFDARAVATLRRGTAIKAKVTTDDGRETTFSISLKGLAPALDRTAVLLR
ncbi:invasion associated locus B family protein [Phreatobacter stygius]|uniref:Invasion associated locus B family protein n=1 Tax=Phreatobacter stygius TaxID=1940610 RepID=A0A4D7BFT1_9HYPH|nr:invasion associated locus B family protein [Phreatobacter stygius]QCI66762.1 invasion associated locus B family protein [Phreatobacter stygius]